MSLSEYKYGSFTSIIHDLHTLYCIQNNMEYTPLKDIVTSVLGKLNNKSLDFYQFSMPLYKELFPALYKPLSENKDKLLEYKRTQRLYTVLAPSYDMSIIYSNSGARLIQQGYRAFIFKFDYSLVFNKPGVLYRISLPNLHTGTGILSNSFTMNVCLLFINIPHMHKQRCRIITINDTELIVYYEGNADDSRRFYDLLMRGIRRAYSQQYTDELSSNTYCVVYSHL